MIKAEAVRLGFSFAAITHPGRPIHYQQYLDWVARGYAGEMVYLTNSRAVTSRKNPAGLLPNAKSLLVLGFPYQPTFWKKSDRKSACHAHGLIAAYALYPDYHKTLRKKAAELTRRIDQITDSSNGYRVYVDSSFVMEKDSAFMAGAGWIGKNTLLLTPESGSCQFICCILTDLEIPADQPYQEDLCGVCRKCLDACPTGCLADGRILRADECIAYLTIENKGIIPRHLREAIGNHVFGCDECQSVCPHNRKVSVSAGKGVQTPLIDPLVDLMSELRLTPESFTDRYAKTPVLRATYAGFKRNLLVAIGNTRSTEYLPALENVLLNDPAWLLRLHAAWAIGRIGAARSSQLLRKAKKVEQDARVIDEISYWL